MKPKFIVVPWLRDGRDQGYTIMKRFMFFWYFRYTFTDHFNVDGTTVFSKNEKNVREFCDRLNGELINDTETKTD